MKLDEINPSDRKFWPKEPEPGFSPERNKKVIEGSIKKYEITRSKKQAEYRDTLRERTDAIATFLKAKDSGYSGGVERYFGKRNLAALRGEDIITKIKYAKKKQEGT